MRTIMRITRITIITTMLIRMTPAMFTTRIAAIRTGRSPLELAGPGGWKRGLTAIVAVGLRPCSGAILILVYTLAQGLFWAGVAATFIMGLGTAITVAVLATLAVNAQGLARRFAAIARRQGRADHARDRGRRRRARPGVRARAARRLYGERATPPDLRRFGTRVEAAIMAA